MPGPDERSSSSSRRINCIATSPGSPGQPSSPVIGGTTSRSIRRTPPALLDRTDPAVTFLCSPNNPTGVIESPARPRGGAGEHHGPRRRRRGLRRVLVLVGTRPGRRRRAPRRRAHVLQDVEHGGGPTRVCRGPHVGGRPARQGCPAVSPRRRQAARRHAGRDVTSPRCTNRVSALVEERGRVAGGLADLHTAGVEAFPSGANFILVRFHRHDAHEIWRRLLDAGVLVRDCSGWPGLDGCLRVTIGLRSENDRFLAALGEAVLTPDRRVASVGELT